MAWPQLGDVTKQPVTGRYGLEPIASVMKDQLLGFQLGVGNCAVEQLKKSQKKSDRPWLGKASGPPFVEGWEGGWVKSFQNELNV